MSKPAKIFVGILSFWPLAYMFIFFAVVFGGVLLPAFTAAESGEPPTPFLFSFGVVFVLHGFTILSSFGLIAFYVYRFFRDDDLDETQTLLWSLLVFVGNMLAFPFAWYVHVWTDGEGFESLKGGGEAGAP